MTTAPTQEELTLDSFEKDLVTGSIKKMMAGIKAEYVVKAEGAGGSADLWKVPPQELRVMAGFNTRISGPKLDAHIRDLANSMKNEGYYQDKPVAAIVLAGNDGQLGLYVTDGHCRLKAALLAISEGAEFKVIPVVTEDGRTTTLEDLTVKLYRSNTGKEMSPFEIGLICKRLSRADWSDKMIGERLGIKPQYVDGLLRLVSAPKALRDAVTDDKLAATEAIKMIRQYGAAGAVEELEKMMANAEAELAKNSADAPDQSKPIRLTARHASNANVKKAVKKHGVDLYLAAKQVKSDPAYATLKEATRIQLDALLAQLEAAETADSAPVESDAGQQAAEVA